MNRRTILTALLSLPSFSAQRKNAEKKGPEVQLIEATAHVEDQRVNIDGRVRIKSERPIRKLNYFLELLDADRKVLTRQQGSFDEDTLAPGDEALIRAQISWHARAVSFRVEFEDGNGRELLAENAGPFAIE